MYICLHCGHTFETPVKYMYNTAVKMWDEDASCPNCGSEDFEEAAECRECGALRSADSLIDGLCEGCLQEAASDLEKAYEYGNERKQAVEVNGILARAFTATQIEDILTGWLMNNGDFEKEFHDFALDDWHDFAEWLKERDA